MILNNGQRYASSIHTPEETESFVVFFQPRFAEAVLSNLELPADRLLDEPGRIHPGQMTFPEGMYPQDELPYHF